MNTKVFFHSVSATHEKILTSLAVFKFLTTGQLLHLKIMSDRANLNKQLLGLRNRTKPLVGCISFGVHPKLGRLQHVYYLTVHGAELLREVYGESYPVRFPKGSHGLFQQDYFHRINTIWLHMAMVEWLKQNPAELVWFRTYFDKLSSDKVKGYRAESAIIISEKEYLIADALCILRTSRREELYAVEMYNGNDTNRVHHSLLQHLRAILQGQPSDQFGYKYGSRVLCVFEHEVYKVQAMKRVSEDERFECAKNRFLFKSMEELKMEEFFVWWLFDGTKAELFMLESESI